jgi:hypothetical protein
MIRVLLRERYPGARFIPKERFEDFRRVNQNFTTEGYCGRGGEPKATLYLAGKAVP